MLPESFPARGEHLSQQWPLLESLDLSSFEPGKTLTSAVVAELTSGAKQLVNTHIEEDVTVSAEENLKRVLKCAKILQFAFELEQYQARRWSRTSRGRWTPLRMTCKRPRTTARSSACR